MTDKIINFIVWTTVIVLMLCLMTLVVFGTLQVIGVIG